MYSESGNNKVWFQRWRPYHNSKNQARCDGRVRGESPLEIYSAAKFLNCRGLPANFRQFKDIGLTKPLVPGCTLYKLRLIVLNEFKEGAVTVNSDKAFHWFTALFLNEYFQNSFFRFSFLIKSLYLLNEYLSFPVKQRKSWCRCFPSFFLI